MLSTPRPQRQDESTVTDADLAALLSGEGAAAGLRPVADILAALTAEATAGELAGEAHALDEYRRRAGVPVPRRQHRLGPAALAPRFSSKVAAAATGVAVLLGGAATAAYADVLPAPIQRLAHDTIGAPYTPGPRPGAPGRRLAAHGQPAGPGSVGAQGRPGTDQAPHAEGTHQRASGQGNQGSGQGQQGTSQGQQGTGQGSGQSQGNPHPASPPGNPHQPGQHGNPHAGARHPRWPAPSGP